ncbi:hypothetical protein V8C86DRAFT_3108206 [Haematococcus lacustris]
MPPTPPLARRGTGLTLSTLAQPRGVQRHQPPLQLPLQPLPPPPAYCNRHGARGQGQSLGAPPPPPAGPPPPDPAAAAPSQAPSQTHPPTSRLLLGQARGLGGPRSSGEGGGPQAAGSQGAGTGQPLMPGSVGLALPILPMLLGAA